MSTAEARVPHPDVAALLDRCRVLDVALTVEDGRLVADGPDTAEVDALLTEVRAHRAEVMAHLRTVGPLVRPSLLPITEREQVGLLALAGACGWPAVRLWTGHSIGPGALPGAPQWATSTTWAQAFAKMPCSGTCAARRAESISD